jgi:hypothetical protein
MVSALRLYGLPVWHLPEVVKVLFGEFILEALQVKEKKKTTTTKRRKKVEWIMKDYV